MRISTMIAGLVLALAATAVHPPGSGSTPSPTQHAYTTNIDAPADTPMVASFEEARASFERTADIVMIDGSLDVEVALLREPALDIYESVLLIDERPALDGPRPHPVAIDEKNSMTKATVNERRVITADYPLLC